MQRDGLDSGRSSDLGSEPGAVVTEPGRALAPLLLPPNPVRRFYRGGSRIAALRGTTARDDQPEDWLGSTTCVHGSDAIGLSLLPDGTRLVDAISADPVAYLGPEHVAVHGPQPALLLKLLDAGERLPVHAHPDRAFARTHLGGSYGKTEAWLVIGTDDPVVTVHLGFSRSVAMDELGAWVEHQDIDAMLDAMNRITLRPGDTCLVPAGLPHAIGAGALIVELQEPTDLSVLLEWRDFDIDGSQDGHLGLGFATALQSVDRSPWTPDALGWLRRRRGSSRRVLPRGADPYFRAEWAEVAGAMSFDAGFSLVVAVNGTGTLSSATGATTLHRGDVVLVPHGAGPCEVRGDLELIRCRPPAPMP